MMTTQTPCHKLSSYLRAAINKPETLVVHLYLWYLSYEVLVEELSTGVKLSKTARGNTGRFDQR